MAKYLRAYQIWLVLKKNFMLQIRHPIITIIELLLPLLLICIVIAVRHLAPVFKSKKQCFVTFEPDQLIVPYTGNYTVYYTPNNSNTSQLASIIQAHLPGSHLVATNTEDEFVKRIMNEEDPRVKGCFYNGAGIVFHNYDGSDLSYTLRLRHETPTQLPGANKWFTQLRSPRFYPVGPRVYDNSYLNEGFLHLEHIVGQALIQFKTGSWPNLPSVEVRQLPHDFFEDDMFLVQVKYLLPFFVMISFILSVAILTKELVVEKESRIRETLKMNGLTNGILWMTWFIKQFLFLILPVLIVGVLLVVGRIFPRSNIGAVLLFMFVYLLTILCFSFFTSVWFNSSRLGMTAGFIFWFLSYLPHVLIAVFYDQLSTELKIISCLLPNTCMGIAVNIISVLELRGDGLQFSDYVSWLSSEDPFNIYAVVSILLFNCFILMVLAWYINEWRPGKYGVPRKFYFPLQPSYWTGHRHKCCRKRNSVVCPISSSSAQQQGLEDNEEESLSVEGSAHEKLNPEPAIGIDIKGLKKKFKAKEYSRMEKLAVNNLYLKMYKGQITALLGHNGAGKTTTMSILTGLFPPTGGAAYINGLSVVEDIDIIRRNLGICPQYNVLFDRLTVREHLNFFARLKGVQRKNVEECVTDIISQLKLENYENTQVKQLSGGYKRKLSVGIALVGDPDVIILDEPTSGMDYVSRNLTWDLLSNRKNEKTILITTHNIDDAEKADRIAILVDGKLSCSGRPSFLKERYGVGYKLRIELTPHAVFSRVHDVITRHIRTCEPINLGSEIHVLLPIEHIGKFSGLFGELEGRDTDLGIISFNVQENKLEDVFIKAGEGKHTSWNAQIRQLSHVYSQTSTQPPRPSLLTKSPSLNSTDLNTWAFQPTTPTPPPLAPVEEELSNSDQLTDFHITSGDFQRAGYPALDQSIKITSPSNHSTSNISNDLIRNGQSSRPSQSLQSRNTKTRLQSDPYSRGGSKGVKPMSVVHETSTPDSLDEYKDIAYPGRISLEEQSPSPKWPSSTHRPTAQQIQEIIATESANSSVHNTPHKKDNRRMLKSTTVAHSRDSSLGGQSQTSPFSSTTGLHRKLTPSILDPIDATYNHEKDKVEVVTKQKRSIKKKREIETDIDVEVISDTNYNPKLWLQQYRAMFIKRYINFKRFHMGVIWQLLLPLLFVVMGLVLGGTINSNYANDPRRALMLSNSAPSTNLTLFHALFVDSKLPFSIEDLEDILRQSDTSALFDYTHSVLDLKDNINNHTNINKCCQYKHQILDKYCVSLEKDQLSEICQNNEFGYRYCKDRCLSCCQAKKIQLPSCSNPRYQYIDSDTVKLPLASEFCPTIPKLAKDDYVDPQGPLQDMNTFMAEYLLNLQESDKLFFENVLGGFTLTQREPTYTVCGCEANINDVFCSRRLNRVDLLNSISQFNDCCHKIPSVPLYCTDDFNFLDIALGLENVSQILNTLVPSNISVTSPPILAQSSGSGSQETCNNLLGLLSNIPSCFSVDGGTTTSLCLDISCNKTGICNFNNQSMSGQYGHWENSDENTVLTLWYNNQPYHVTPTLLNLLHTLYLRQQPGLHDASITVYNHPLPRHPNSTLNNIEVDAITFLVGISSMFGFSFLLASFSLFIVQEKSSKAKHLQITSGLHLSAYWLANLTWDLLTSLIPVLLTIIAFAIGQIWVKQYSGITLLAVGFLFLFLCWAQIPAVYLLSLPFNNIYTAYTSLFLVIFMVTFGFLSVIYIVGPLSGNQQAADILHYIFLLNPSYGLAAGLSDLYVNHVIMDTCKASPQAMGVCQYKNVFYAEFPLDLSRPGIGIILIYLFLEGIFYFILTLFADHFDEIRQWVQRKRGLPYNKIDKEILSLKRELLASRGGRRPSENIGSEVERGFETNLPRSQSRDSNQYNNVRSQHSGQPLVRFSTRVGEDKSVKVEKEKVKKLLKGSNDMSQYTVIVGRLSKCYHQSPLDKLKKAWRVEPLKEPSVNDVNIALEERSCFGLMGYNGAGKSTIFKMLTGEIAPTTGTALISGYNIRTQLRRVQQNIGYCPQFDALIERLTGRELLTMFARLRGIPEKEIPDIVQIRLDSLKISSEDADKQCWKYSGGNRRKLSTAIALMGNHKVILLDEPTTGMDIQTRHEFIVTLTKILGEEKKSIILTSHSMNECEALCNKIGIMIKGEFRCIGPTLQLKEKYGEHETKVTIRVEHYTSDDQEEQVIPLEMSYQQMPGAPSIFLHPSSANRRPSSLHPSPVNLQPNHGQLPQSPSRLSRLQSIGRFFSRTFAHEQLVEELDEIDGDTEEDDNQPCDNPYLQEVSNRVRSYFGHKEGIKRISVENNEVTFTLPKRDIPLSEVFNFMQTLKGDKTLHIVSYSVSQSTLDQVFNHFVREQQELDAQLEQ